MSSNCNSMNLWLLMLKYLQEGYSRSLLINTEMFYNNNKNKNTHPKKHVMNN